MRLFNLSLLPRTRTIRGNQRLRWEYASDSGCMLMRRTLWIHLIIHVAVTSEHSSYCKNYAAFFPIVLWVVAPSCRKKDFYFSAMGTFPAAPEDCAFMLGTTSGVCFFNFARSVKQRLNVPWYALESSEVGKGKKKVIRCIHMEVSPASTNSHKCESYGFSFTRCFEVIQLYYHISDCKKKWH